MIDAIGVVFPRVNEVELQEIKLPDPGPEDVVVETEYTGISIGTEGWILSARYWGTTFPLVTGYQKVGLISHVGEKVEGYNVGDRVFLRDTKLASPIRSMWGGHTSRSVADYRSLIPLPDGADPVSVSLLVMVAVGYHGAGELVNVQAGDLVVIIGQGLIGQFAAQVCKQRGCTVITSEPHQVRRELSAKLGADVAADPLTQDVGALVRSFKEEGADVIVDCSANVDAINASFQWLKNRGSKYCFQAYYPDLTCLDLLWPHIKEMVAYNPTNVSEEGMREMMQWIADGRAQVRPLITHFRNWREAPALFDMMMNRPSECLGMVLDWQDCHQ
ncbi:MAG: zinc-binding dehydrogenase [Armatimonadota bacterium]